MPFHRIVPLLASLLVAGAVLAEQSPAGTLSDAERQELPELFDQSEAQYLGLLASVSDGQWTFKQAVERWSVGECAEHIMLSNRAFYDSAQRALATPPDPDWQEKTKGKSQLLLRVMPNRSPGGAGGASAPQEVRPRNDVSRAEIVRRFRTLYDEIRAYVKTTDQPLKQHIEDHPFPIFGSLNAYDWILYVPLHTIRHTKQMIEVTESPGYPSI